MFVRRDRDRETERQRQPERDRETQTQRLEGGEGVNEEQDTASLKRHLGGLAIP